MNLVPKYRMRIDSLVCFVFVLVCQTLVCPAHLLAQDLLLAQDPLNTQSSETAEQIWVGWIESPESHLRWIVRVKKQSEKWAGSIQVPDRSDSAPIALSKLNVSSSKLSFTWQPTNETQEASFVGNVEQNNIIKGLILKGDNSVFSQLKRVEKVDEESPDTLGADSVWTDQPRVRAKILPYDLRLRIYSSGPFFDGNDRILLDSRSSSVLGAPVKLTQSEGAKWSFKIPSLKVEYLAELDPSGDTLSGFLMGNSNSKALQLHNWNSQPKKNAGENDKKSPVVITQEKNVASKSTTEMEASKSKSLDDKPNADSVKIKLNEAKEPKRVSVDGEDEFLLSVASPGTRSKNDPPTHQLGCTLKLPSTEKSKTFPLAIIVSTFDAQERDGIVGESRIYKQLAFALAEKQVATIRFDDRGTGSSSPPSADYGMQEAVADLRAVLEYAKGIPEIDKTKIGFVGHGFGATLSTKVAMLDSSVAFLICIAPPGLDGSRLLLAESQRTSELEKLDDTSLSLLIDLQKDLHSQAQKPATNEARMALEFDDLFKKYWPRLEASIPKPSSTDTDNASASPEQLKTAIEEKLRSDLAGLRTKFNREFLKTDPSSSWMMLPTPTLAIWGSKDVQVDAEKNLELLKQAVRRNPKNRISWLVLPNLNHLLQECKTGLPSEYQELGTAVAASAIDAIAKWLNEQRITNQ
ncbi:MAG: alpha/beta hydrolase [Pirellula sp.]|jgi:pimeloyl-ACP methyl ester carboxylesterase